MSTPLSTTLGGALQRWPEGFRWRDGTPEPRVRDMLLRDLAPNFRCIARGSGDARRTYVEVPASWRLPRHWPSGRIDTQVAQAIDELLRDAGTRAPIFAEGLAEALDDHRLTTDGWLVDVAQWDAVMSESCGVWWDTEHQAEIMAKAQQLGGVAG